MYQLLLVSLQLYYTIQCYIVCSTVRVWRGAKQCDVLTAHKPAVWAIASLFEFDGTRRILSGIDIVGE